MQDHHTFVYVSHSLRDAEMLKLRLAGAGIEAEIVRREVSREAEDDQATGSAVTGVTVTEKDGRAARRLIADFDPEGLVPEDDQPGAPAEGQLAQQALNLQVVYAARTAPQAYMLKNVLVENGIPAEVINHDLSADAGFGAAISSVLPQVVVAGKDAEVARQIAVEFDRNDLVDAEAYAEHADEHEAPRTTLDAWPTCPQCDARRSTRCLICGTAGSDFGPADANFLGIPALDTAAGQAAMSCGPGGCGVVGSPAEAEVPQADEAMPVRQGPVLMCPTCDEPFEPAYPRICEWCNHEFPDGVEVELWPVP